MQLLTYLDDNPPQHWIAREGEKLPVQSGNRIAPFSTVTIIREGKPFKKYVWDGGMWIESVNEEIILADIAAEAKRQTESLGKIEALIQEMVKE